MFSMVSEYFTPVILSRIVCVTAIFAIWEDKEVMM